MGKPRFRRRFDRALFVLLIIAGAIGCALWDVHAVGDAIAAGKFVPAPTVAVPIGPAAPSPTPAASASPGARATAVLAGLVG